MTTTGRPSSSASATCSETSQSSSGRRWWDSSTKKPRPMAALPTRSEDRRVPLGDGPRASAIADPQPACDLALAAAGQRDHALGVLGEQRLAEPRHALGPVEIRAGDEPAQAAIARRVPREQHQVRAALPLADPAQVLLDRAPVARQPGAVGPRPRRQALDRRLALGRPPRRRRRLAPLDRRRAGMTMPVGIGRRRIQELDLDPEHRPQAHRLGRGGEPHHAVQPVVIGDGQPGQPELRRPLGHVLDRRGAVQEREVGVAVELGVGRRHRLPVRHCVRGGAPHA